MARVHSPRIVTDGLSLCLDAANLKSYPGSGTTWTDLSGNSNIGTLTNGPTYSSDNGGSIVFDGTNDYVDFGSNGASAVNGLSEVTVEIWYKSDSVGNDTGLIFGGTSNTRDNGISIRFDSNGFSGSGTNVIKAGFGQNNSETAANQIESSSNIQSTDWICITVVCDLQTSIKLYKNGVEDTPTYTESDGGSASSISNCDGLVIGYGRNQVEWDGKISNVKIYNRVLTASEVTQNYNALKGRYGL